MLRLVTGKHTLALHKLLYLPFHAGTGEEDAERKAGKQGKEKETKRSNEAAPQQQLLFLGSSSFSRPSLKVPHPPPSPPLLESLFRATPPTLRAPPAAAVGDHRVAATASADWYAQIPPPCSTTAIERRGFFFSSFRLRLFLLNSSCRRF